ncbi:MAG: peptide deformylase, partial [Patescibacteria group bacterium]
MKILTIENKKDEKYLRTPVSPLDFKQEDLKELRVLIRDMRKTMREAPGVGLSANQVGVS